MNIHIDSINEIKDFLNYDLRDFKLQITTKKEKYIFINKSLKNFRYRSLSKKEKGIVKKYLKALTGYSDIQLKRLIKYWKKGLLLKKLDKQKRGKFKRKYTVSDIALLVKTDLAHSCLNGKATKKILRRLLKKHQKF